MSATTLPLELQQQIFSFLDSQSFFASRDVCRWWRHASTDPFTLSRQLRNLPVIPPTNAYAQTPIELKRLYAQAAHTLMLDLSITRQPDSPGNLAANTASAPRICATTNGDRTVTLNDRTIALLDTSSRQNPKLLTERPLNDLKETVGNGPWLRITPNTWHEMALSSDGSLLAVAQERTIQIYNLLDDADSFTVNEYIPSAAGHYICGLAFEQRDHMLRVQLSGRGTVLYLGTPPSDLSRNGSLADIEHWRSRSGLRHAFLDSSRIALVSEFSEKPAARISGLQLLAPYYTPSPLSGDGEPGFLFAAQRHGGSGASQYIMGHVRASHPTHSNRPSPMSSAMNSASSSKASSGTATPDRPFPLTVEPDSVTILAELESYLSAWEYVNHNKSSATSASISNHGMGLWENMPSAHEHHPTFALNREQNLLVLAEKDKKAVRPKQMTQIFVYRVPGRRSIDCVLEAKRLREEREGKGRPSFASLAAFLRQRFQDEKAAGRKGEDEEDEEFVIEDSSQETTDVVTQGQDEPSTQLRQKVARLPLCLTCVQGELTSLSFDGDLIAETAECTRTWMAAPRV